MCVVKVTLPVFGWQPQAFAVALDNLFAGRKLTMLHHIHLAVFLE